MHVRFMTTHFAPYQWYVNIWKLNKIWLLFEMDEIEIHLVIYVKLFVMYTNVLD